MRFCGNALMVLGALVVVIGLITLRRSIDLYGFGYEMTPFITIGSDVGVCLSGVFFCALAEIIRRLPEKKER